MLIFYLKDVKSFMNILLKESLFDSYEARGVSLRGFTGFEIDCLSEERDAAGKKRYCLWNEIKPVVFELIKGKKKPGFLKVCVCITGESARLINENACALHMTITYENGAISVLTGSAQNTFTLDKAVDHSWDNYAKELFIKNGFEVMEEPQ